MYIGVDIGGTKCAITKADEKLNICDKIKFDTTDKEGTLKRIIESVHKMGDATAIGISCGGPLDSKKGIIMSPPNLPSQIGVLSAFINDVSPEMMYAQLAYGYANENDLLIGLSTSGNSKNVVNAVIAVKARGAKTISMTGMKGSKLSDLCDCTIQVPETETYKIQELHLPVYHYLCAEIEKRCFNRED